MAGERLAAFEDLLQEHFPAMYYGHFILLWSIFEESIEIFIYKKTGMSPVHGLIVLSGLGLERKASIARSLMSLEPDKFAEAKKLLNQIIQESERNHLIHGQLHSMATGIEMVKITTDQELRVRTRMFTGKVLSDKRDRLAEQATRLSNLLGITSDDMRLYEKTAASFVKSAGTSPSAPSS
jgi:hypothetical protein